MMNELKLEANVSIEEEIEELCGVLIAHVFSLTEHPDVHPKIKEFALVIQDDAGKLHAKWAELLKGKASDFNSQIFAAANQLNDLENESRRHLANKSKDPFILDVSNPLVKYEIKTKMQQLYINKKPINFLQHQLAGADANVAK
jgi:hypothetical protein